MKQFTLTFFMALNIFLPTTVFAGGDVGNGGDVVLCQKSAEDIFEGTLSLDYMLTLQDGIENDLKSVSSFGESIARIFKIMTERCHEDRSTPKIGYFSNSLNKFLSLRANHTDWSQSAIWHSSAYGLVDIHDQRMSRLLPTNCQINGGPNIIQAIIRKARPDMNIIIFEYDPAIDLQLQRKPLQQSFLYMHEFLRNYLSDIDNIRWLNWFLHSQQMEKMNDNDFLNSVNRLMGNAFCRG